MVHSEDISDIIRALSESGFEEAEVRLDDLYIRVSNQPGGETSTDRRPSTPERLISTSMNKREDGDGPALDAALSIPPQETGGTLKAIKSPTLGTFYRAPSPGAPPFIKVGGRVEAGQAIGLVEVMKLFNTVETDVAGTVVELHAEDGVLVEYDQPLITIRVD